MRQRITVKDLIEKLHKFPDYATVLVLDGQASDFRLADHVHLENHAVWYEGDLLHAAKGPGVVIS